MCNVRSTDSRTHEARFLPRPHWVDTLASARGKGLSVLVAPAGYGKSWLLEQLAARWSREEGGATCWRVHADTSVAQALRGLARDVQAPQRMRASRGDERGDALIEWMAARDEAAGPLLIDVDGAPPQRAVQALIVRVVMAVSVRRRVVLCARHGLQLPVERLAVRVTLQTLGAPDLALHESELTPLAGSTLAAARAWLDVSEGWPVLYEAPLDPPILAREALIEQLACRHAAYFEREILAPLSSTDVRLLMHLSVVGSIEPGMLEAFALGATWSRLAALIDAGLPQSQTAAQWDRIVLHPVFRRFLHRRLLAHAPVAYRSLHRRAAHWFAASGRFAEAMQHAQETGDPVLEAQIVERSGGWRASLLSGLQALSSEAPATAELAVRFPRAALARIYWLAQTGRIDEATAALARLQTQPMPGPLAWDLHSIRAVIAVYRDEACDEDMLATLARPRGESEDEDPLMLPGGSTLQAALLNNAGRHERAAPLARAAVLEAQTLGSPYVAYYGHLQHALALHGLGRLGSASQAYQQAHTLAQDLFAEHGSEIRILGWLQAHLSWLRGEAPTAHRAGEEPAELYRLHGWFDPLARVLEIAQAQARAHGGRAAEDQVLDDVSDLASRRGLIRLQSQVALARARQARAEGQLARAQQICAGALGALDDSGIAATAQERVRAPLCLEQAHLALAAGTLDTARAALDACERCARDLSDAALTLNAGLVGACLALRERRTHDAAQRFAQIVQEADRLELRRPFLDHAGLVMEWVRHAHEQGIAIEARVLDVALQLAGMGSHTNGAPTAALATLRGGSRLTARETDILRCLAEGLSGKEMARHLAITEATVKTHRKHLYEKLGVGLRSQAIVKARELGVL